MQKQTIAPKMNAALLAVLMLQLLSMIDGLTTSISLFVQPLNQFQYEMNSMYFPLLAVKTLVLCMASFMLVEKQLNRKVEFAVLGIAGFLGSIWFLVIANNLWVIFI